MTPFGVGIGAWIDHHMVGISCLNGHMHSPWDAPVMDPSREGPHGGPNLTPFRVIFGVEMEHLCRYYVTKRVKLTPSDTNITI